MAPPTCPMVSNRWPSAVRSHNRAVLETVPGKKNSSSGASASMSPLPVRSAPPSAGGGWFKDHRRSPSRRRATAASLRFPSRSAPCRRDRAILPRAAARRPRFSRTPSTWTNGASSSGTGLPPPPSGNRQIALASLRLRCSKSMPSRLQSSGYLSAGPSVSCSTGPAPVRLPAAALERSAPARREWDLPAIRRPHGRIHRPRAVCLAASSPCARTRRSTGRCCCRDRRGTAPPVCRPGRALGRRTGPGCTSRPISQSCKGRACVYNHSGSPSVLSETPVTEERCGISLRGPRRDHSWVRVHSGISVHSHRASPRLGRRTRAQR